MWCNIIIGEGQVGKALSRVMPNAKIIKRNDLDLSNINTIKMALHSALDNLDIGVIVNTAAYTNVDKAESEKDIAMNVNCKSVGVIAQYAKERSVPFIHLSTDFVFDGNKRIGEEYYEDDPKNPINYYGLTKSLGEDIVSEKCDISLILRLQFVYSAFTKNNFVYKIAEQLMLNDKISVVNDQFGSPTNSFDIANAIIKICKNLPNWFDKFYNTDYHGMDFTKKKFPYGIYHLTSDDTESRNDVAMHIMSYLESNDVPLKAKSILSVKTSDFPSPAQRPLNLTLNSGKLKQELNVFLPDWRNSLDNAIKIIINRYNDK
jgi:dTDP-4-dehydrorhamnose reductase